MCICEEEYNFFKNNKYYRSSFQPKLQKIANTKIIVEKIYANNMQSNLPDIPLYTPAYDMLRLSFGIVGFELFFRVAVEELFDRERNR